MPVRKLDVDEKPAVTSFDEAVGIIRQRTEMMGGALWCAIEGEIRYSRTSTVVEVLGDSGSYAVRREGAIPLLREVVEANSSVLAGGLPAREIWALFRAAHPSFDLKAYGFTEFEEVLNLGQDKGLLRIEADPDRGLWVYPSAEWASVSAASTAAEPVPVVLEEGIAAAAGDLESVESAPAAAPLTEGKPARGGRRRPATSRRPTTSGSRRRAPRKKPEASPAEG